MPQVLAPENEITIVINAGHINDYRFITPLEGLSYIVANYTLGNKDLLGVYTVVNKQQVSITGQDYLDIADAVDCVNGIDNAIRTRIFQYIVATLNEEVVAPVVPV